MYTNFYIPKNKLNELKYFIKKELPTARFQNNPIAIGEKYNISLTLSVEDGNKLNKIQEEWYNKNKNFNK